MIQREIFSKILPWIGEKKILIIKGARQVGKTTLLQQLKKELEDRGEKTVYFAVDQERLLGIFEDPHLFIKFFENEHGLKGFKNKKLYIFLDEFQYIKEAGQFLKVIFDKEFEHMQLIVSGSSSLEITKNSEYLTGRKIDFFLHPFSFREHLLAHSKYAYNEQFDFSQKKEIKDFYSIYRNDLEEQMTDFVYFGGYPEVVTEGDSGKKELILKNILQTYIEKDVAGFLRVQDVQAFNNIVKLLCSQIGQLLNQNEISGTIGLHKITLGRYIEMLQGTFVFSLLRPFFKNIRKELTKMPKIYCEDLGIVSYFLGNRHYEKYPLIHGQIIENFVFNELKKMNENLNIYFYRTIAKAEIDFIIEKKSELIPIEVKFRQKKQSQPVAVKNFLKNYNVKKSIILTQNDLFFQNEATFLPVILLPFIKL